jgi:hypothetical protein
MTSTNNTFVKAKQYLEDNAIIYNINVLSSICSLLDSEKNKNTLYNELIITHNHADVNLILSTLSVIKNNKTFTNIYINAIRQTSNLNY